MYQKKIRKGGALTFLILRGPCFLTNFDTSNIEGATAFLSFFHGQSIHSCSAWNFLSRAVIFGTRQGRCASHYKTKTAIEIWTGSTVPGYSDWECSTTFCQLSVAANSRVLSFERNTHLWSQKRKIIKYKKNRKYLYFS